MKSIYFNAESVYPASLLLSSFLSAIIMYAYMETRRVNLKKKLLEKERIEKILIDKKDLFIEMLNHRFAISKQILIMNSSPIQDQKEERTLIKINELFYGQADINFNNEEFYDLLNEIHGNFSIKISDFFPDLNEEEIRICCLLQAGFNTSNICFILRYAPITIRIKKTKIRKKLGITDGGDIINFLNEFIEKQEEKRKQEKEKREKSFFYSWFSNKLM